MNLSVPLLLAVALSASPVSQKTDAYLTTKSIYPLCKSVLQIADGDKQAKDPDFQAALGGEFCLGVTAGAFELSEMLNPDFKSCPPDTLKRIDVLRLTLGDIDRMPEAYQNAPLAMAIAVSMHEKWPCPPGP
jgi:hypothetical protein